MKQFLIVLSVFLFSLSLHAQSFTGKVVNKQGQPIAFANVIAMNADSVFLAGDISDAGGIFRFERVDGAAWLKISYIGYREKIVPFASESTDWGRIELEEDMQILSEVVVKGDLPATRIKGEAMVTHIAGSVLEKAGSARDVLVRLPGVAQNGEDLNVFGRGVPLIFVNGREVRDPAELTQITSDHIKSVEVITNPGARYAKSVKAVIRIQTKKKVSDGFGFSDRANLSYNDQMSYRNQLNLTYRREKIDLTGMLDYSDQSAWRKYDALLKTDLDHVWKQQMHSAQDLTYRQLTADVALAYMPTSHHALGGNYRYRRYPQYTNALDLHTNVYQDASLFEESTSRVNARSPETRHEGNFYYNGKVGAWNIDFNGTLLHNKELTTGLTQENITDTNGEETQNLVHTSTDTRNTFYAGKLVLSRPLFNGSLSFGGEYTHTLRTSTYRNPEGIVADDDSKIKEDLEAAFLEYGRTFGKIKLQAGLRFENVNFDYYKSGVYQNKQSRNYHNFFPSLLVFIPIGKIQTQLSYASDITRPSYEMLRNRVDYVNRYTYETGNPFLQPTLVHTLALKGAYKWWLLYADFQRTKDAVVFSSEPYSEENPNLALLRQVNAPSYNAMNFLLNANPTVGCWSPRWSIGLYKQWYTAETSETPDGKISLDRLSFSARWGNAIELPFGFTLDADLNWNGKNSRENQSYKSVWWADASLYKDFFRQRLTLLVQANDLFNTYRSDYIVYYGRIRTMRMDQKMSRRSISFTVQYKFNLKKSTYKGTGAGKTQKGRL